MNDEPAAGERIVKRLARAGLCSRRDAERWIKEGRVSVDGVVLTTPAFIVTDNMEIKVDGKVVSEAPQERVWLYHKPNGLLTTHKDPQGRPTIFESLPKSLPRVISIGRLDLNSEGLLLLTNSGEVARYAELPATGWARTYEVRVYGRVNEAALKALSKGITIDGITYGAIEAKLDRSRGSSHANSWVVMTLHEGKNREIRKVMMHLGLRVNKLIRVSYGPFVLGDLKLGQVREVTGEDVLKAFPHIKERQKNG